MKRLLGVLLLLGLCLSFLTANGTGETAKEEGVQQKPVLTFMTINTTVDLSKEQPYGLYKDVTGYDIKWESLASTEQLMLLIASGEEKDLIAVNRDQFNMVLAEKAAMDITDLIDEYGPDIKKAIPTLFAITTIDGKIYGIPSVKAAIGFCSGEILGRKDLIAKAGLKDATDIPAFYNNLVALKKAYPNMVPLGMDNEDVLSHLVSNITSGFGFRGEWMETPNGKVINYLKNPGFADYLAFMTKLYDEGLLDPDFPALTRRDKFTKFSAGKLVMIDDSWDGCRNYVETLNVDVPESIVEPIPFLKDSSGLNHVEIPTGADYYAIIPANSKHAIDTIKAVNEILKKENQIYLAAGEEGVHWTRNEATGGYNPIQPKFNEDKLNAHYFFAFLRSEVDYNLIWQARLMKSPDMYRIASLVKEMTKTCDDEAFSPVVMAPAITCIENYASIQSYLKDGVVQIITGKRPLGYLNDLIAYWNANGGQKVEDFYSDWYVNNKK